MIKERLYKRVKALSKEQRNQLWKHLIERMFTKSDKHYNRCSDIIEGIKIANFSEYKL